ncbi:MAG TPA: hypothetical protein VJ276_21240 [Thermoanaerobaculia bacterium]|nr:hypothetical protein [Thermoanaerobaculia bacterium]
MRSIPPLLLSLLLAGGALAAPPTLQRITILEPTAETSLRASAQLLEWSDGSRTVYARRALDGADRVLWTFDAETNRFTAEADGAQPRLRVRAESVPASGYQATYYVDANDSSTNPASRTWIQATWGQCPGSSNTQKTVQFQGGSFSAQCTLLGSGIGVGYWQTTSCTSTPPPSGVFTVTLGGPKACCAADGKYLYTQTVYPTDVPHGTFTEPMEVKPQFSVAPNGIVFANFTATYAPGGSFTDYLDVQPAATTVTCPDPPTGGGPPGSGCLQQPCGFITATSCVDVYGADGTARGSCCGATEAEITACAERGGLIGSGTRQ